VEGSGPRKIAKPGPVAINNCDGILNRFVTCPPFGRTPLAPGPATAVRNPPRRWSRGPASGELTLNDDGSFNYVPAAEFRGQVSVRYTVSDGASNSNKATITVNAVNDPPVATRESYVLDEDTSLTVVAAGGVLGNDSDVEGAPLSAALVNGPAHGTLTLAAHGAFSYSPEPNFNGTDSFTYRASDGPSRSRSGR